VTKYDTSGTFQWDLTFDTGVNDVARSVAVDASGVYVAGYTHNPSTTDTNAFVRKYNLSGTTLLWQSSIATVLPDYAYGVAVDSSGVYVAGYTKGDLMALPLPAGSAGLSDVFVVKLNLTSGAELWKQQYDIGTLSTDAAFGVAADGAAVYIAGSTGLAQSDAFLRKLDMASGAADWTKFFGGNTQDDAAFGVSADTGGIYIAGCTHDGTADGSCQSGDADAFVRKYNSAGSMVWSDEFGGTTPSFDTALSVTADLGSVYVGGYTGGQLPGQTSFGDADAYVRKYNAIGIPLSTTQFGSLPATSADLTWGVVAANAGGVYAGGYTNGTLPGQTPAGGFDAFLVKDPEFPVTIDIKPGAFPNTINLGSNGTVPVAILSTATFNATTVDPATVTLAEASVALKGKGTSSTSSFQDVNGDGRPDLLIHIETEALQLSNTDTIAILKGQTFSGQPIIGSDFIRVIQ
jgi:hypothetical protein